MSVICAIFLLSLVGTSVEAEDLGRLSANPFDIESSSNPFGKGSPYRLDSPTNPYRTGLSIERR